jgi:hypothetical protein
MMPVSTKWTNIQLFENLMTKFNISKEDQDQFDNDSLVISVDIGEGADTVDDLTEIKERNIVIVEINNKKSATKIPTPKKSLPAKTSMMSSLSKPKIGGLPSKPMNRQLP